MKRVVSSIDVRFLGGWITTLNSSRLRRQAKSRLEDERSISVSLITRVDNVSLLMALCEKYGTDKGGRKEAENPFEWQPHMYILVYELLFAPERHSVKRVFECGIGSQNLTIPSNMGRRARPGASLKVWRDFFPEAEIYGADIDRDILQDDHRISTFYVDQLNPDSIESMWSSMNVREFDIIIDDGLHEYAAGSLLFQKSWEKLRSGGYYVIEDVVGSDIHLYKDFFESVNCAPYYWSFPSRIRPARHDWLIVLRRP